MRRGRDKQASAAERDRFGHTHGFMPFCAVWLRDLYIVIRYILFARIKYGYWPFIANIDNYRIEPSVLSFEIKLEIAFEKMQAQLTADESS